jgi:hypothetical protein
MEFIVYTYNSQASPPCHAYGPYTDEAEAHADAKRRSEADHSLTAMVLPLEPVAP